MTNLSTEARLREALERLKNNSPITQGHKAKLRANKPLKINKSSVEKEAGLSNGATKHYPNLINDIENAEADRLHGDKGAIVALTSRDVKASPLYQQLEAKLEKAKAARKAAEDRVLELKAECNRKDIALNEKIIEIDELIASLWELIPRDTQRSLVVKKAENIVRFLK
ncbi:hypothetical protein [uncultured Vibrio sp.]|uniref:hypothetical protein n=1 Tax=uncultured Vibrio sp. TaxID=114054 RepID=UPI0026289B0B|nr:hypothetical protein [uncultured Vibrio sp.]